MEYTLLVISAIIIPLIFFTYSLVSFKKKFIICTIKHNNIKNKALRVTLFDGEILTNDWTNLIIDEEVFKNLPSEDHHKTYRLSIVKSE